MNVFLAPPYNHAMPSRAETLYREIESLPVAEQTKYVEVWVSSEQPENDFLDFKSGKADDKSIRRIWSEALSGFANTEGGILVWGIDFKSVAVPGEKRKIDRAFGFSPIPNPPLSFVQFLKDHRRNATVEPVGNVEYLIVPNTPGTGSYVLTLIPPGNNPPYRDSGENKYWYRNGDSFEVVPHTMLRTMFYPRILARFSLAYTEHPADDCYTIHLLNAGRGTADDLFVQAFADRTTLKILFPKAYWEKTVTTELFKCGEANRPLHPNQTMDLVRINYAGPKPQRPKTIGLNLAIYCRNQDPVFFRQRIVADVDGLDIVDPAERITELEIPT